MSYPNPGPLSHVVPLAEDDGPEFYEYGKNCGGGVKARPEEVIGRCSACDALVDADGDAVDVCSYSPECCAICGHRPCDQSC
jgi:hypothetical protein